MRLPSLDHLSLRAFAAFKRFPATLVDCIIGAIAFIADLQVQKGGHYAPGISDAVKLGLTCLLGLPIFFAIELWLERRGDRLAGRTGDESRRRPSSRIFLYLAAACFLGFFYFQYAESEPHAIRLMIFILAAHLAVSFVAYLRKNETNGFWQFNKVILLRILTALLYSFVLQLGLSLALMAIDRLFKVTIEPQMYAQLACVLAIFNTWFFLAGVPYSLANQEQRTDYPKGLKIFTQFVLLPLVTIYLAILYPYAVKLLIEWDLPRGWVSNPVLWFAVVGILSFLLLYPIRNESGNEWIKSFSRYYFIALLPLLALPALGIYTRVRDYGITEPRYFVILLTLWLLGIALYFILSKKKDIRLIPITLCIVAIISSIGPASAFSVSRANQYSRLDHLLEKHKLIGPSRNIRDRKSIPVDDYNEVRSISIYLMRDKDQRLEDWLRSRVPADVVIKEVSYDADIASVLNFTTTQPNATNMYIRFGGSTPNAQRITGYDYYVPLILGPKSDPQDTLLQTGALSVYDKKGTELIVTNGSDVLPVTYASIFQELRDRRDSLIRAGGAADSLSPDIHRATPSMELWINFHDASVEGSPGAIRGSDDDTPAPIEAHYWGSGSLFIKLK